jgi:NitT/TauT family transport system substrate-binding protein
MKARILLVAVACAIVSACSKAPTSGFTHVRLAIGGQAQMVYLPVTLAVELGYYRAQGLDVAIQDFPGGSRALEALLGASADVVAGFYDHTIQMAAEGRDIQAFVSMLRYPGFVAVASPASKIRRVEDLRGRVAGVTAPGSSSHFFLNHLLVRHGLAADAVSITGIGATASAIAAVTRGKVDCAIMFEPAVTMVRQRSPDLRILADTRTAQGVREIYGVDSYPGATLYSTRDWITRNPETARKLAHAIRDTLIWIQGHSAEEISDKMPVWFRGEDREVFATAMRNSMAMFSSDGRMTGDGAEAVKRVLAASIEKVWQANPDVARTYTNTFLDAP